MITRLRRERLHRGWTQTELAYHARVSQADVSAIETGRRRAYRAQAARIAHLLGIPAEDLQELVP